MTINKLDVTVHDFSYYTYLPVLSARQKLKVKSCQKASSQEPHRKCQQGKHAATLEARFAVDL